MEIKPGYKQTEVGVIPEDWEVRKLGVMATFRTGPFGSALHRSDYVDDGIPIVNPMQILNGKIVPTRSMAITAGAARKLTDFLLPEGSVVIGRRGDMGRCAVVEREHEGWLCGTGSMIIRAGASLDARFLQRMLSSKPIIAEIENASVGTTMINLNQGILGNLRLPLPPTKREQENIAEALSDTDALIDLLERLLVKKRHLKQGSMQELLTGKKRLPGFTGKWESKLFGAIAQPRKQRIDPRITTSNEFCIELEHIEQATGSLGGYTATGEGSSLKSVFQKDDVLFGKLRAYLRKYWLADREGVCSTEIWVLVANSASLVPPYLFQIVRTDRFIEAASTAYGTHMPRSDWNVVKNFELQVPPPDEQMAIAAILSDMDAEITAFETKLTKARQLKQGMMQELLTGRIRLVRSSAQVLSFPAKDSASVANVSHNTQINEAVVIAVLSARFGSDKFPLGRFRRTKLSYLLHRHVEHEAAGFMKKAAGPYNPRTRYGGAEKIALQNRYVRVLSTGKSEGFVADENIAQAEGYFDKWYGAEALTWLEQFRFQKNDALELLTTVDMACQDLSQAGKAATLSAVKQIIHDSPEWKAKLNRAVFSDNNIATTIQSCGQLFPIEEE
jgi:type I restriction enzyme, S subunit